MSKHDWKPGDVAWWSERDCHGEIVFRYLDYQNDNQPAWHTTDSGDGFPNEEHLRPLIVIDPEDAEQVRRLTAAIVKAAFDHGNTVVSDQGIHPQTIIEALRALSRGPKPAEPLGLGAVVEDDKGRRWSRVSSREGTAWCSDNGLRTPVLIGWELVPAVRIVSEGVEVDR